jgi:hypothetical protein
LLLEGMDSRVGRPLVHLQAARAGYLCLMVGREPALFARTWPGRYGATVVRSTARLRAIPPIRAADARRAPGRGGQAVFVEWWVNRFATRLLASSCSPIGAGRTYVLAPIEAGKGVPYGAYDRRGKVAWTDVELRSLDDSVLLQRETFALAWDFHYLGLVTTRVSSEPEDGRVKAWRKVARERRLPPLLVWWCPGLFAHVLLDGHDRLHAAMLEGKTPDIVVLADLAPTRDRARLGRLRRGAMAHAKIALDMSERALGAREMGMNAANALAASRWDPRLEWTIATPAFPLEGGVRAWKRGLRAAIDAHGVPMPFEMFEVGNR